MLLKKWTATVTSLMLICMITKISWAGKSVFIISKHYVTSKAEAFSIDGNEVTFQATVDINSLNPGIGAVGNAVWPDKELMFVTYEGSPAEFFEST